jgi:hypothetical protein
MEPAEVRYWVVQPLTEASSWKVLDAPELLDGFDSFFEELSRPVDRRGPLITRRLPDPAGWVA